MRHGTVLVAGGAGFVGSQLVRELVADDARVVVLDNFQTGGRANLAEVERRIEIVVGDLLDEWCVLEVFRRVRPTHVFNLVGETFVPAVYDAPKRFLRTNVEGHLNLLMACRQFDVVRVVHASSAEVYGHPEHGPVREDHPLGAANTYAVTKLAADRLCATMHAEHGVPVSIARLFNAYGPRETEPYVIPEIIAQLHAGGPLVLGDLDARRDYTYVEDTARGLLALMRSELGPGRAVNIGSNSSHSVREIAEMLAVLMDRPLELRVDPARLRRQEIAHLQADASLLRAHGWAPRVPLREGLERTVRWFADNGHRWPWQDRVLGTFVSRRD